MIGSTGARRKHACPVLGVFSFTQVTNETGVPQCLASRAELGLIAEHSAAAICGFGFRSGDGGDALAWPKMNDPQGVSTLVPKRTVLGA
jgi:hypothetical protein